MSIAPPQRTMIGPYKRMGNLVGFETPTIIRHLMPLQGDLITARFAGCHFDETVFLSLGGDKNTNVQQEQQGLSWSVLTLSHLDPRTAQSEIEVRRILDLQNVADSMPDAFSDIAKVTRSHIPVANVPARIDVPKNHRHGATPRGIGHGAATTNSDGNVA